MTSSSPTTTTNSSFYDLSASPQVKKNFFTPGGNLYGLATISDIVRDPVPFLSPAFLKFRGTFSPPELHAISACKLVQRCRNASSVLITGPFLTHQQYVVRRHPSVSRYCDFARKWRILTPSRALILQSRAMREKRKNWRILRILNSYVVKIEII